MPRYNYPPIEGDINDYVSFTKAAAMYNRTRQAINIAVRRKKLKGYSYDNIRMVKKTELAEYMETHGKNRKENKNDKQ